MNAEASRDPERFWHCWTIPKGMNYADAEAWFKAHKKPSGYVYELFRYDHRTGIVRTV